MLNRTHNKELEIDKKGNITSVYDYVPISAVDNADPLQRFRYVKVEATSFTVSEPFETNIIAPVIYQQALDRERKILEETYDVIPFEIQTIKMERIFADKIFAAEFYYLRKMYFDTAKHVYDLTVMMEQKRIKKMFEDNDMLAEMITFKRREEMLRIGSDLYEKEFSDFIFFEGLHNKEFIEAFDKMQNIYVFNSEDRIDLTNVMNKMSELNDVLLLHEQNMEIEEEQGMDISMV